MSDKILVAYATKHGATAEIAEKIGEVVRESGQDVAVFPVKDVKDISPYSTVILGSAVYMGAWRREAGAFLKANEISLSQKKVWLFSSGPTGKGDIKSLLKDWTFPRGLKDLAERIKPRGHEIFRGDLREDKMGGFERWVIKKVKAPLGDFRDWEVVAGWARSITDELKK